MSHAGISSSVHSPNTAEKYVSLSFDKNVFLFKQNDIYSFESLVDVDTDARKSNSLGVIKISDHDVPVYCLDDDLALMQKIPSSRPVCVILKDCKYALLCKDIRVLDYDEMNEFDLPECMSHQYMPIFKICLYKKQDSQEAKVAMLVSCDDLRIYIYKNNRQ